MKVLIIEDTEELATSLKLFFELEKNHAEVANNLSEESTLRQSPFST